MISHSPGGTATGFFKFSENDVGSEGATHQEEGVNRWKGIEHSLKSHARLTRTCKKEDEHLVNTDHLKSVNIGKALLPDTLAS